MKIYRCLHDIEAMCNECRRQLLLIWFINYLPLTKFHIVNRVWAISTFIITSCCTCPNYICNLFLNGIFFFFFWGWSGGAKVLCILHHQGVQLILAYSWARPAIFVVGKGRGGMFLYLLFLHFNSCSSFFPVPLFHLLYYLFSPFLWKMT